MTALAGKRPRRTSSSLNGTPSTNRLTVAKSCLRGTVSSPTRSVSEDDVEFANEFTPDATYLEVKRTEATYYYELGVLDAENLDMFYVGRGNRLAYTRAK